MKFASIVLAIGLATSGCGTDSVTPADASGGGPVTDVSGHITSDQTWSGTINVTSDVSIDSHVTVTVMPGTSINVPSGAGINVAGTLDIQGTAAGKVGMHPTGNGYNGINVSAGGTLTAHYLVQVAGGIHISGTTAKATLIDTAMSRMSGDFLTMSGGTLDMEYSRLGLEPGMADTTHCDMHVGGAVTMTVTHSDISTSAYGLMFYGGSNANFTFDNWFGNSTDIDTIAGFSVSGDFSSSWFERGAPNKPGFTTNNMSTARISDAGPRS